MTTETSPLNRQPDKLDYSSPTQFRFMINQLPKVQFFTTAANIPDISLGEAVIPTPYKDIPIMGDKITFGNLDVSFIVDEYLENYVSIHNWIIGIGFPKNRQQFSSFRSDTSNNPTSAKTVSVDRVGSATPDRGMYSDATLTILSNKNNPLVEVRFTDIFPVSLSGLSYDNATTDIDYLTAQISFRYKLYEIVTL
tara:strand:+ start:246 stop:830 length:585 start_codon:yes stop_codon:yes gene_type:complete